MKPFTWRCLEQALHVEDGSDDYLWILSRTPKLTDDVKTTILNEAKRRGYKTEELVWVKLE